MKKHNLHTTLSSKHWELRNKYVKKFETQQKVLECALECLEKSSNSEHGSSLSPEEEYRIRTGREIKSLCIVPKLMLKELIETVDIERFTEFAFRQKLVEYAVEHNNQKPLQECSLKEVMDATVMCAKVGNAFDIVSYTDNGGYYILRLTHDMGLNNSKINKVMVESLFKTLGVRTETSISDRDIFMKIYKNL